MDLTAPTAPGYTAPVALKVGVAITPMNPSGGVGIDGYGATGLPSGLDIDTGSGVISGTPDTVDADTATARVTVGDTAGNTATTTISFPAVAKGDQALTGFAYSASSVTFGSAAPTVTAPTGVLTTLGYSATPAGVCAVDPSTGAFTLVGAGDCEITATAAGSSDYNEATATFTVTVRPAGALVLNLGVIAGDNTISIAEKAAGFTIGGDTGTEIGVEVTRARSAPGRSPRPRRITPEPPRWSVSVPVDATYITGTSLAVTVNASKTGYSEPAAITRTLTVDLTAPTAPGYTAPVALKVGVAITPMNPSGGVGIDGYGATGLPSGLDIDTGSGVISGTPDTVDADTATARVTVGDTAGNTATTTISFPAVAKGDQALGGFAVQRVLRDVRVHHDSQTVTAPTGVLTTLSYSATPDSVCAVDASSGRAHPGGRGRPAWSPRPPRPASDYNAATATFTVTVLPAGALALNLGVIAGDNTVSIAEQAAGFDHRRGHRGRERRRGDPARSAAGRSPRPRRMTRGRPAGR